MSQSSTHVLFDCTNTKDSEGKPLLCCSVDCKKYYMYHCKHCVKTSPVKESTEHFSGTGFSLLRDQDEAAA